MCRKIIAVLIALAISIVNAPVVFATDVVAEGSCGENVSWVLTKDGTLTISGQGPMENYSISNLAPWIKYHNVAPIRKFVVMDGVTSIADYAMCYGFTYWEDLTEIVIPPSVTKIGEEAFAMCDGLMEISIPEGVISIDRLAFRCYNLKKVSIPSTIKNMGYAAIYSGVEEVYYNGTEEQWEKIDFYQGTSNWVEKLKANATIHYNGSPTPPTPPPTDEPSEWAKPIMEKAITAGLVPESLQKGWKDGINRQETAALVVSYLEASTKKSIDQILLNNGVTVNPSAFTDTTDANVLAVNALDIVTGFPGGEFKPNGTLTRAQAAVIICNVARVLGYDTEGYSSTFSDTTNHWANKFIGWPAHEGIVAGVGNNKFNPDGTLTKEQAIAILYSMFIMP